MLTVKTKLPLLINMIRFFVFLVLGLLGSDTVFGDSSFKGNVNFECEDGKHLFRTFSQTSEAVNWVLNQNDNRWGYECRNGYVSDTCSWSTTWENDNNENKNFTCSNNAILTGFKSEYDEGNEDRKWKIKCCDVSIFTVFL